MAAAADGAAGSHEDTAMSRFFFSQDQGAGSEWSVPISRLAESLLKTGIEMVYNRLDDTQDREWRTQGWFLR